MVRVILAPKERLTPFDLRGQNFRVNVEFSTYYRGLKKIDKMTESDLSAQKKFFSFFFETVRFIPQTTEKICKKKFSYRTGPIGHFFKNFFDFCGQNGYQKTPFGPLISVSTMKISKFHQSNIAQWVVWY